MLRWREESQCGNLLSWSTHPRPFSPATGFMRLVLKNTVIFWPAVWEKGASVS